MEGFDIFLSHNSADKPSVEVIAHKLKDAGVEPWLDKWCLVPGKTFQSGLADALRSCPTCAVFIGPAGVGDWAREETAVGLAGVLGEHGGASGVAFAWPAAKLGVMGPQQAVGIIHRRAIAAESDPAAARERLAREYAEEHLNAHAATREGFIDEVVAPSETRDRLNATLTALDTGGREAPQHTNIPL